MATARTASIADYLSKEGRHAGDILAEARQRAGKEVVARRKFNNNRIWGAVRKLRKGSALFGLPFFYSAVTAENVTSAEVGRAVASFTPLGWSLDIGEGIGRWTEDCHNQINQAAEEMSNSERWRFP